MLKTRKNQSSRSTVDLSSVMNAIGNAEWKYDSKVTKAMIIERTAKETGKREAITFSQAYGELSMWLDKAFANISESGFSDMIAAEIFPRSRVSHQPRRI
jgi:hypothetical protein